MLVGLESQAAVSRIEKAARKPTTATIVACAILFDLPLDEVFPALHEEVGRSVFRKATALREVLSERTDKHSLRKCAFLDQVLCRITNRLQPPPS